MNDVSDNADGKTASEPAGATESVPGVLSFDPLLQMLCYLATVTGLRIPLTLQVGGLMISGILIDRKTYDEGMNSLLRNVAGDEATEEMKELFGLHADTLFPVKDRTPVTSENTDLDDIHFINLMNARIYGENASIPNDGNGVYWRGPLSAVDGFFWGTIGRNRP